MVEIDTSKVRALFRAIIRQFPYATMKALNRLVLEAQRYQRYHQRKVFEIRQKTYWQQSVKVTHFAKINDLRAVIDVDPKGKVPKFDIWRRQEFGGTRVPTQGRKKLAVPPREKSQYSRVGLTFTGKGLIPRRLRPANLKRTFTIDFGGGRLGLFRRLSRRQKGFTKVPPGQRFALRQDPNIELMYILIDSGQIDAVYHWFGNMKLVYDSKWRRYLDEELVKAFRTAKIPGFKPK